MITIANNLVLSILLLHVSTTVVASSMLNNIVKTIVNNIVRSLQHRSVMITVLLQHSSTNNAVTTCAIFNCVQVPP